MIKHTRKISKEVEAILKPYNEEIKDYIKILQKKSDADMKQHIGALSEDFQEKVKGVAEQYGDLQKDISDIKKTLNSHTDTLNSHTEILNSHTEMIGQNAEAISKVAIDVDIIKTDIGFIKGGLKKKVDYDEFLVLERRMSLLESKIK